jgi:hypothetical protein
MGGSPNRCHRTQMVIQKMVIRRMMNQRMMILGMQNQARSQLKIVTQELVRGLIINILPSYHSMTL